MLISEQLALLDGTPTAPAPRRHRCPTCHAGFAPVGASQRIAEQREAAGRDYTVEWSAFVVSQPTRLAVIIDAALRVAHGKRPTMDAVWLAVADKTGQALDHNWRAPAARWLMQHVPALAGRFVVRERAGQVKERGR